MSRKKKTAKQPSVPDRKRIRQPRPTAEMLRLAIKHARKCYQQTPGSGHARLAREHDCLFGVSQTGALLVGVIAGPRNREFSVILREVRETIQGFRSQTWGSFSVEVFIPPDIELGHLPNSIGGIRVEWFRWVIESERGITLERLRERRGANSASNSDVSILQKVLGHLAWWEQALRKATTPESPHRKALLVLNAATLIDWHSTVPGRDSREQLRDAKASKKAAKLIAEFVVVARTCVSKTEFLTATNAVKPLGTLASATAGFLTKVTKLYEFDAVPRRLPDFDKPLRPAELISEWLAGNKRLDTGKDAGAKPVNPMTGEGAYAIHSLLPVFAAQNLFESGKLTAQEFTAVRQTCEGYLNDAIEIAASGGSAAERRKWRALGKPVAEALRRPVDARSRKAGA